MKMGQWWHWVDAVKHRLLHIDGKFHQSKDQQPILPILEEKFQVKIIRNRSQIDNEISDIRKGCRNAEATFRYLMNHDNVIHDGIDSEFWMILNIELSHTLNVSLYIEVRSENFQRLLRQADEIDDGVESGAGTSYLNKILQGTKLENESETIVW